MSFVQEALYNAGFSVYLHGYSAIDSWLGRKIGTVIQILTNADTAELARLFEDLRYPGIDLADAALDGKDSTYYFHHADSIRDYRPSFKLLEFYQDCKSLTFYDPCGIYPVLAEIRRSFREQKNKAADAGIKISPLEILKEGLNPDCDSVRALMDTALILAKYFPPFQRSELQRSEGDETEWQIEKNAASFHSFQESRLRKGTAPGQEEQRFLLSALMTSPNPGLGLEFLKISGFIEEFWPELAILDKADHSKEFHPEGNAWEHTLETFRYRKGVAFDLRLSLGLLLHDTGKPISVSAGSRRYDGHAELGEIQARRFLERLGFGASLTNDVCWLVRHHMLPAALPRLPLFRTAEIMSSHLFPLLMELYRCDESSSFKGLDGYYESSAAYQSFLRNRRNPYRSADVNKKTRRVKRWR